MKDEVLESVVSKISNLHPKFLEDFFLAYLSTYEIKTKEDARKVLESVDFVVITHLPNSEHLIKTEVSVELKSEISDG